MINPKTNKEKFILEVLEDLYYLYKVPENYKNIENKIVKYLEVLMLKESLEKESPNQENKPKKLKL
jgi:hypothetical protein